MTSVAAEPTPDAALSRPAAIAAARRTNLVKVVLWMIGTLLCFSIMAVSIRVLSTSLGLREILSIRNGAGLLLLGGAMLVRPQLRHGVTTRHMGLHLLRNVIHYAAQYGWAYALTLLPLATVFALEFTMPGWTVLLAVLFLGERLTASRLGTVVLGFLGVLVILRPGLESFRPAALIVLVAAFGFAITMTTTKRLTNSVSTFGILFWMNLIQLPLGLIGSDPLFLLKVHGWQILGVLGVGLAGTGSHFCLSNAFRSGDAILVVPLDFLRIPLIALVGWAFYGEALDVFVFLGAGLIVSGVLWNSVAEARRPTQGAAMGARA